MNCGLLVVLLCACSSLRADRHRYSGSRRNDYDAPRFKRIYANLSASEGDRSTKLVCKIEATKSTYYWWLKNGQNIDTSKTTKYKYKQFRYLKIKNLKKEDAGEYTCVAQNKAGKIEHKMTLYVEAARPAEIEGDYRVPQFKRIVKSYSATQGDRDTKLICQVKAPKDTHYWWLKNGRNIDTSKTTKYRYKQFRYLKIKNLKWEDAGEYTCVAQNKAGKIEHKMRLYVEDDGRPVFKRVFANHSATAGDGDTKLICQVQAPKDTQYWWLKNGQKIDISKTKKYKYKHFRYLRIKNLKMEDAGEYTCAARNKVGKIEHKMILFVAAARPIETPKDRKPYFTQLYKMNTDLLVYPAGNTIKMVCDAAGVPQPTVVWYKYGEPLNQIDSPYPLGPHEFTLTIMNALPKDSGMYTCNVSNPFGWINKTYKVHVEPVFIISKPVLQEIDNITAYEGDNVTVTCKAICECAPHFQWLIFDEIHKNLTVLPPNLRKEERLAPSYDNKWHGVKLFWTNVSKTDEREYTCMAGTGTGYDYQSFFLHVLKRRPMPTLRFLQELKFLERP